MFQTKKRQQNNMASDRPEQNDAEQDEENREQNDLQEIADLKIQGKIPLSLTTCMFLTMLKISLSLDDTNTIGIFFTLSVMN